MSVQKILRGAKFAEDTVDVCMRQDLDFKVRELAQRLAKTMAAKDDPGDSRLAGRPDSSAEEIDRLEAEIRELEDEMGDHTLTFHMRGISTGEYNVLQRRAGRPRKENKPDQAVGYNIQAFFETAIKRCTYKVTAPDGDEQEFVEEDWKVLFESISDAQMDDLCRGVETVNRRPVRSPSKARSYEEANGSEPRPEPLTDSESATSDSSDGSLSE